jgi:hypothetical protein
MHAVPEQQLSDLSVSNAPTEAGGQVSRDPDAIQREIEETRAELARTVDLIAERLSPRRAASRGASKVKSSIDGVFHREDDDGQAVVHTPQVGAPEHDTGIRSVPLPDSAGGPQLVRTLRTDRVVIAAAAVAALVGAIVFLRRRHR